jgi:hypothetical protein
MRKSCVLGLLLALGLGTALAAYAQDDESRSLGDVARQSRLAKQQKDRQAGNNSATQSPGNGNATTATSDTPSQNSVVTPPGNQPSITQKNPVSPVTSAAAKTPASGKLPKKVITNEDMGDAHIAGDAAPDSTASAAERTSSESTDEKFPPDYWATRILAQKNAIASMKSDVDKLSASIQYAPGNCVEGCVEWNQHQQEKQQQVDSMKAQLEEMQKQLEDMQDSARKQGYGSSVYDP